MNKRIFLTLTAVLITGAVLYKMPSWAGEEQPEMQVEQETSIQEVEPMALAVSTPTTTIQGTQQVQPKRRRRIPTVPTMDEQSAIREEEKNIIRPLININTDDVVTLRSGRLNPVFYMAKKMGTSSWNVLREDMAPTIEKQTFQLYTILLDEDIQYLKEKVKMLEEKLPR